MTELFINGRYLLQRMTGVQRVAQQIVGALDRRGAAGRATPPCTLLLPPGAEPPSLAWMPTRHVAGPAHPHLWEQWALPRAARGGLLLNLCGASPAFAHGPQACVLHDAAVFDHPEAYTANFVRWYRWLFRRQARQGARLLTVSAFSRARLAAALAVPPQRLAVLPLGGDHLQSVVPDAAVLETHGLRRRPFVLAVGSMNPTKRLDRLMRVWAGLPHGEACLVIAGGLNPQVFAGGHRPDVPGVVFTGPVGDAALKALYGAALGLVFPSIYEGFGLPPLEAMASGCPVVASRAASLPEVCGDAALMVNPDDDVDLAAAIGCLLTDRDARDRLTARGRARAAGFTWDTTASALLAALSDEGAP